MPEPADVPQQNCPACGAAVNVAEAEPLARVACPSCGEKFRVETAFDNFVLVETLGVGGMGSVYKAQDTRLQRFVALKLLRKDLSADPVEAARLEQEARVTAAINHPNVVQVYSSGTAHGQIYLVMELVDHGSLDDLMTQKTRLPERQVLEAGIQVAKGLQAAHEKGLIHRDVKPANILFSDAQTAKIGDFGLAGAAEQKDEARKEIWGTPYYVAPERLNNEPEDFRSDIYSLGATLFHALAGRPPMEKETTSATELRELKNHPPPLRTLAPEISPEAAEVIDQMLAPNPAERFASYTDLIEQLQRAALGLPATGFEGGSKSRRKAPFIALLVGVVALLIAAGAYTMHKRTHTTAPVPAPAPSPSATPDNSTALQQKYEEARRQLLDGKLDAAASAFSKIASQAQNRQPLLNWTRLHLGMTALLQNKTAEARDVFQQIEHAGAFSTAKADTDLARFFTTTSNALAAPGPIRAGAEVDGKSVNPFALLLFGLKDWQLREFDDAAALLQKFMASEAPNEFKWLGDYKPIARKYLEDHAVYIEWKRLPQRLTSAAEAQTALENLRALEQRLQTRGALTDALKDEEKRLSTAAANLEGEETQARERKDAEEVERQKPVWLAQWKSRLVADLKSGAFRAPITMGQTTYQGVTSATDSEITLRIAPYGGTSFKWDKFPPSVLLSMSTAFIRPGIPDAAERQWLCAVYAASTKQTEAAHSLGESAARAKPEYANQLRWLLREE